MNLFKTIVTVLLTCCILLLFTIDASALELKSRYCTITYSDNNELREFNHNLYMGRLRYQIKTNGDTIGDEVIAKINFIVEKVMAVLDMFPPDIRFSMVILPTEKEVQQDFYRIYHVKVEYIAFFSPSENTVFYSVNNINLRVASHEIGHMVVKHYFKIPPPQRIHELLAQFAEKHVTD